MRAAIPCCQDNKDKNGYELGAYDGCVLAACWLRAGCVLALTSAHIAPDFFVAMADKACHRCLLLQDAKHQHRQHQQSVPKCVAPAVVWPYPDG
jgi:hypothetical protein